MEEFFEAYGVKFGDLWKISSRLTEIFFKAYGVKFSS